MSPRTGTRKSPRVSERLDVSAMKYADVKAELELRGVAPHKKGAPGCWRAQLEFLECQLDERFPGGECEHGTPRIFKCGEGCECEHGMPLTWGCKKCGTGEFV